MQGGILCAIADAAMGTAYVSALADGESMTTLELKMNFLRPVRQGRLVARASSTCLTLQAGEGGGVAPPEEEGA